MKLLLISFITILSTSVSALACTDFSGTYKDKNNSIVTITQVECVCVEITQDESSSKLNTDGYLRLLQTQDAKNGDAVVGKNRIFGTAKFNNERMDVNYKIFTTYLDNSTEEHSLNLYFNLDNRNNLIIVMDKLEGDLDSAYFTRQPINNR